MAFSDEFVTFTFSTRGDLIFLGGNYARDSLSTMVEIILNYLGSENISFLFPKMFIKMYFSLQKMSFAKIWFSLSGKCSPVFSIQRELIICNLK